MSRSLRIEYPGAWYHVMNRGSNHQTIFHDTAHFNLFLELLSEVHQRFEVQIHAYCLMNNHYHLLLYTPYSNLSQVMQYIGGVYTRKYNSSLRKDGPLFRARFKSILIDADSYLLELGRYIHLNPVKAKIVKSPEEYPWSSYKYYINQGDKANWLYLSEILSRFGDKDQIIRHKKFVLEKKDEKIEFSIDIDKEASIMGSSEYIQSLEKTKLLDLNLAAKCFDNSIGSNASVDLIINRTAKYFGVEPASITINHKKIATRNYPRKVAIYLASKLLKRNSRFIVENFSGLSHKSVREVCRRLENELKKNPEQMKEITDLKASLLHVAV